MQEVSRSNQIFAHFQVLELSAPIQAYEGSVGLSLKDDNRLLRKLIYFQRRKWFEFSHMYPISTCPLFSFSSFYPCSCITAQFPDRTIKYQLILTVKNHGISCTL
ncbi:hypothetical protein AMECASPLE_017613 [Ameca splendens]|uniref:Uncharacterized protein n=1 Tax=Ameca splendens TaxID=208324 RepID=A0ABV0ZN63_9TELE